MKKEDYTIFEYRMEKEKKNCERVLQERLHANFEQYCIYTELAGYITIAIYKPEQANSSEKLPAVFNFHGGGFVLGFYELDGKYCQRLANQSGCAIVNVDYCLAPEFKFPIPILASYEVLRKVKLNQEQFGLNCENVMVMGQSAGGNIACALSLLNREETAMNIVGQIINYAPLSQSLDPALRHVEDPTKAISRNRMLQYINWYFADHSDMKHPLASPLGADLHNLPKTLVTTASLDSLCEEGLAFATKAKASNNDVIYHCFTGCQHGFTHDDLKEYNEEASNAAWNMMADFIRSCMWGKYD